MFSTKNSSTRSGVAFYSIGVLFVQSPGGWFSFAVLITVCARAHTHTANRLEVTESCFKKKKKFFLYQLSFIYIK